MRLRHLRLPAISAIIMLLVLHNTKTNKFELALFKTKNTISHSMD